MSDYKIISKTEDASKERVFYTIEIAPFRFVDGIVCKTISILKRNAAFVVKKLLPCMYRSFGTMTTKIISNC